MCVFFTDYLKFFLSCFAYIFVDVISYFQKPQMRFVHSLCRAWKVCLFCFSSDFTTKSISPWGTFSTAAARLGGLALSTRRTTMTWRRAPGRTRYRTGPPPGLEVGRSSSFSSTAWQLRDEENWSVLEANRVLYSMSSRVSSKIIL